MKKDIENKLSWGELSKYRGDLFGLAIIQIMIFHYFEDYFNAGGNTRVITLIGKIYYYIFGAIGVEIFLFLSGMGLYYSLTNNNNIKDFYIRRFTRVLPTFLIVSVMYYFWRNFIYEKMGVVGFLRGELFINFVSVHDTTYWFILLILIMYLVFPYLYRTLLPDKEYRTLVLMGILGVWLLTAILAYFLIPGIFANTEILYLRVPIFILGLFYADKVMNNSPLTRVEILLLASIVVLKVAFNRVVMIPFGGRSMATIWSFPIMFAGVWLCKNFLAYNTCLHRFVQWTGSLSLELYIIHVSLREVFNAYNFSMAVGWHYMVMIVITYLIAILLKKTVASIINNI